MSLSCIVGYTIITESLKRSILKQDIYKDNGRLRNDIFQQIVLYDLILILILSLHFFFHIIQMFGNDLDLMCSTGF